MTDGELLELAAKAAGMKGWQWVESWGSMAEKRLQGGFYFDRYWNPLEDDGDALRLAVKLVMEMDHNHAADNCLWVSVRVPRQVFCAVEEFADESERLSATRRAIVRAAAEIGRTMP